MKLIKSVSSRQEEILTDILALYHPSGIDADVTYSKGQFYKSGEVLPPRMKFDVAPQTSDTVQSDSRRLPLGAESLGCVVFDPPFVVTQGPSLSENKGNIIARRFGYFQSERELFEYYRDTLRELFRVLEPNGILIFKCQDKVASGKQFLSHNYILNMAAEQGFYCEDIFILTAKQRLISPKHKNQQHARKYHSYFLVFRKNVKRVKEIERRISGKLYK